MGLTALVTTATSRKDSDVGTVATGRRGRIAVGVDESPAARNAVLWGAGAARRHGWDLVITHVAPRGGQPMDSGVAVAQDHLLNASAAAASHRAPSVVVGTLLLHGAAAEELIRLTNTTRMLVLGVDAARPRSDHGALGSVEDRVVVHARCPVVTVSHPPRDAYQEGGKVVAAWTPGSTSRQVLEIAALEATLESGKLSVVAGSPNNWDVHMPMPSSYEGSLVTELHELAKRYPQLPWMVSRVTEDLASAVSRASVDADLVVMACERSEDRWSIKTGLFAETAMRQTVCPILFINAATRHWDAARILTDLGRRPADTIGPIV